MNAAVVQINPWKIVLEELAELRNAKSRKQYIRQHRQDLSVELVVQLADKARPLLRINPRKSLALSETAIQIARALDDPLAMAHATRMKANAEYALGRYRAAVTLYTTAIELFENLGERTELGRTLSVSILSLNLCAEYERAFECAARARKIFLELNDDLRIARVDINLGNVFHRQDRFAEALSCYRRAYRVVLEHRDAEGIGVVLSNLAVCLISIEEFAEALQTYQEAREVCSKYGMPRLVAQADYNIAYLHYLRGEYSRAIEMLRSTRSACIELEDRYHHALCNLDLSELYVELNLSGDVIDLAGKAREEFKTLNMGYEQAKAIAFQAMAMSQMGQPAQSLRLFSQARTIFVRERNRVWPSLIDLYKAVVLFNEGRGEEAASLANAALEFFDSSLLSGKAVLCRLLLARIAQGARDLTAAKSHCVAALERLRNLQSPILRHQAFLLMGQIHTALNAAQDAYSCFRASRYHLELLRTNVRGQELKLAFLKNRLEVYEMLVRTCLQNPSESSLREAFGYIEESKSRVLMDQMLQHDEKGISQDPQSTGEIEKLRNELNLYYNLIELEQLRVENHSGDRISRLESQVRTREGELLRRLRESTSRDCMPAGKTGLDSVAIEQIRETLPEDTLILEYFQAGSEVLACILCNDRLEIRTVSSSPRFSDALRLLRFQFSKFRLGAEYTESFRGCLLQSTYSHLKLLYDELISPIRESLNTSNLIIVPHGALHYVPFHALWDGSSFMLDKYTVSYAPSASVHSVCARRKTYHGGNALVMGIPDNRAPFIEDEVRSIGSMLEGAKTHFGSSATQEVLEREGPGSRIVHIATHGRFRQDNPIFSAIRLGDCYLNVYDIYRLRLPVELVTLSGCATGVNSVTAGDELIGLARGLFQAGANSLVLSLWDAHDASTAEFMRNFYTGLDQGLSRAWALKQAMREVRDRWPHPYHWASFVLMGAHDPLSRN